MQSLKKAYFFKLNFRSYNSIENFRWYSAVGSILKRYNFVPLWAFKKVCHFNKCLIHETERGPRHRNPI